MSRTIDTPYGPYTPLIPSQEEMERAEAVLKEAVEAIAELNHDVWAAQRITEGWEYGPQRDDDQKHNPCLVAYSHLPESEKEYDRASARVVLAELIRRGMINGNTLK